MVNVRYMGGPLRNSFRFFFSTSGVAKFERARVPF